MRYYIYSKNGSIKRCYAEKLEFSGQFMGSCSLSINVKWHEHIDFEIGDYIEYRGEKYTLSNIPTEKKVAHKNATSQSFQYDNIKFESCVSELSIADFNDFVGDSQTDISFTAQPNFSFVAKTVSDLAQRIQVNLDRYYTGDKKWTITIDSDFVNNPEKDDMLISVSNISCWDALAYVKSKYDTNFIVRGRTVTIGTSGAINDITFKVGKYNGLYDMTRNSQSEQAIITRLKSYGNTTNINPRYYSLVGSSVTATAVYAKMIVEGTNLCMYIRYSDAAYGTELYSTVVATFTYVGATHTASMTYDEDSLAYKITASTSEQKAAVEGISEALLPNAQYTPTRNTTATLSSGVRIENITDLSRITPNPAYTIPNNMNIANLMLPGFPKQTLAEWVEANKSKYSWLQTYVNLGYTFSTDRIYPYIDSKNVSQLGILPHTEYFTSEDETHKDIYPSLQYFQDDRNKVVSITNEDGTAITDSGIFKEGATVPNVKINVNDLGFLISDVRISGTDPKLHFNSGYCGGMDFSIMTSGKNTDGTTYFVCKRVEDDAIGKYFPYKDAMILNGDKFVITDIYMPDTFIEQASIELLKWSLKWLAKNDYTVFSYSLSPDPIFIKRHDDAINDKTTTFYRSIKEGDVLNIQDTDIGINDSITIDTLKITEGDGLLPKYDITLKDTKSVGTIQKMQQQIDAIVGGGDFTSSQIQAIAEKSLRDTFLSKVKEDTASQKITFSKGINIGGQNVLSIEAQDDADTSLLASLRAAIIYLTKSDAAQTYLNKITSSAQSIAGETSFNAALHALKELIGNVIQSTSFTSAGFAGSGYKLWFDGTTSHLEVDEATIRKVMYVFELVISQVKHIGGRLIMSDASCVASLVEEFTDYYTVSFDATDGTRTVNNEWEVGDFAYCQTFNLKSGTRYYWRKVIGVTSEPNANGKHQIQLSKTIYDDSVTNNAPIVGDNIVQLGGVNAGRQSAIILSTVGDDAPSIKQFDGIGQGTTNAEMFSLVGKEKQVISPSGNKFTGSFVFESTGKDVKTLIDAVPGKITLAVNNVQIGGRNLIVGSHNENGTSVLNSKHYGWTAPTDNNWSYVVIPLSQLVKGNAQYTLYIEKVAVSKDNTIRTVIYRHRNNDKGQLVYRCGGYININSDGSLLATMTSNSVTDVGPDYLYLYAGVDTAGVTVDYTNIMLVEGNKCSGYMPSPEDTDAKIQVTADAITSEVTARTAQGEELKTSIKQTADSISAKVATIGSGYNLLPYGNFSDSRASSDKNKWNINGAATTAIDTDATAGQGLKIRFTSGTSGVGIWQNIGSYATYTKDEYVIFSFDARCNAGQTACQLYVGLEGATLYTVNVTLYYAYHRYAIVQQVPNAWNGVVRIYTGATMPLSSFCVRKIKLGRGESDTNYIPSLLDTGIDISKGKITLIADNTTFLTNSGATAAEITEQGLVTPAVKTAYENGKGKAHVEVIGGTLYSFDKWGNIAWKVGTDDDGNGILKFNKNGNEFMSFGSLGITFIGGATVSYATTEMHLFPVALFHGYGGGTLNAYLPYDGHYNNNASVLSQKYPFYHICNKVTAPMQDGKYIDYNGGSAAFWSKVDQRYFWRSDFDIASVYEEMGGSTITTDKPYIAGKTSFDGNGCAEFVNGYFIDVTNSKTLSDGLTVLYFEEGRLIKLFTAQYSFATNGVTTAQYVQAISADSPRMNCTQAGSGIAYSTDEPAFYFDAANRPTDTDNIL